MGYRFDKLPVIVQKQIKKIADVERKELEVIRKKLPDERERVTKLLDKGDRAVDQLFDTQFAVIEVGVSNPEDPDEVMAMADYLLEQYALDRSAAEERGEEYDEDLYYAGSYLTTRANVMLEGPYDGYYDDLQAGATEEEISSFLEEVLELGRDEDGKRNDGKVVPLFGEERR